MTVGVLERAAIVAARMVRNRHATILCYHGVEAGRPANVTSAHVSLRQFRGTIAAASEVAEAVSLRELIKRYDAGRSTAGLFAVTFDDAYASLASPEVRPIITDSRLPVTIFVVSDASASGAPFWWDRIETVHPAVSGEAWAEFERRIALPDSYRTAAAIPFGPLRPLRQWVLHQHAGRWPEHAREALANLERDAHVHTAQQPMGFGEIDALVRGSQIDIGVHTMTHPVLPLLTDEEVRAEVRGSHAALLERWPTTIPWLAAPFGLYDVRTARLAREAGLAGVLNLHAFTLAYASVTHGFPRMNIMEAVPIWKLALRLSRLTERMVRPRAGVVAYPEPPGPD